MIPVTLKLSQEEALYLAALLRIHRLYAIGSESDKDKAMRIKIRETLTNQLPDL